MKKNQKLLQQIVSSVTAVAIIFIVVYPGNIQTLHLIMRPDATIEIEASFHNEQQ